jgi:RNA polymerase sigma factor (sigma-70 family)
MDSPIARPEILRSDTLANSATAAAWIKSPYLRRVACRVASLHGISSLDVPDIQQELCVALWMAGPSTVVNATWLFRTASHKAIDIVRFRIRVAEETLPSAEKVTSPGVDTSLLLLLRARAALLPRQLHEFYVLRYEEGLSQREIATRLGLGRGSIRCLERRCLRMLKGRLAV